LPNNRVGYGTLAAPDFSDRLPWDNRGTSFQSEDFIFIGRLRFLEPGSIPAAPPFFTRQVGRNGLVGCTEANMPMLMQIADRVLDALEPNIPEQPFLFGSRPSNADFALFGQLCQFTLDLAAVGPCQDRAPYTMRWCHHVHDLSGYEGQWRREDEPMSPAVGALLDLAGEAYLPFLVANRAALESGADRVRIEAHGLAYEGAPFKYQSRCLEELRKGYAALSDEARQQVDPVLEGHDCLAALQG
jgi:hypothetical protein